MIGFCLYIPHTAKNKSLGIAQALLSFSSPSDISHIP